jgi:hypothetical protein
MRASDGVSDPVGIEAVFPANHLEWRRGGDFAARVQHDAVASRAMILRQALAGSSVGAARVQHGGQCEQNNHSQEHQDAERTKSRDGAHKPDRPIGRRRRGCFGSGVVIACRSSFHNAFYHDSPTTVTANGKNPFWAQLISLSLARIGARRGLDLKFDEGKVKQKD